MTDKEILDWIENEIRHQIGGGDFFEVMHEIHLDWGLSLRNAIISKAQPNNQLKADAPDDGPTQTSFAGAHGLT